MTDSQDLSVSLLLSAKRVPDPLGCAQGIWSLCSSEVLCVLPKDFCKHLSLTFNRSTLSKQTLSSNPTPFFLLLPRTMVSSWILSYSLWSLTHFLSGEPWHPMHRPEAGPEASSARVCLSSLFSGSPQASPTHCWLLATGRCHSPWVA